MEEVEHTSRSQVSGSGCPWRRPLTREMVGLGRHATSRRSPLGLSCGGALTFDGDASETGVIPVILDADAVGRVVGGSSPVSWSPDLLWHYFSVAYDPEGVILTVAVENCCAQTTSVHLPRNYGGGNRS